MTPANKPGPMRSQLIIRSILTFSIVVLLHPHAAFSQKSVQWGGDVHSYINDHAVDYLPDGMSLFRDHRSFLAQHASDPDRDSNPGPYHYIDIDYYPEFLNGTFPKDRDSLIAMYGAGIVEGNGTLPWVIEEWTDSLSALMAGDRWDEAWQVAAELGHYVADSHQPLHLAMNYDGQLSGNRGIHSRYESKMTGQFLSLIPLPEGSASYWPSLIDSVFHYIDTLYTFNDSILAADNLAKAADASYQSVYYSILWENLERVTTVSVQSAILDLASIYMTAWENSGAGSSSAVSPDTEIPQNPILADAWPNPFNPVTRIRFGLPDPSDVHITIFNIAGHRIRDWTLAHQSRGWHELTWDSSDNQGQRVASGVYIYRMQAGDPSAASAQQFVETKKMVLVK